MKNSLIIMAASTAISVLVLGALAGGPQTQPAADKWARHYYDRIEQFRQENAGPRTS